MKTRTTKQDGLAHIVAAVAGLVVTVTVTATGNVPVAWASPTYFLLGIPVMCMVIYLLARRYPSRAWRWTLSMMLGQVFSSILYGQGAHIPQAVVWVTLLSAPQFMAGIAGARAGLRLTVQPEKAERQELE